MKSTSIFKALALAVLTCTAQQAFSTITYISTNKIWSPVSLDTPPGNLITDEVVILPGGKLTITNMTLKINGGYAITVWTNPGAVGSGSGGQIVVSNATITTDDYWSGIHVKGNPAYKQNDVRMAKATLTNSTIERASYGVTNWDTRNDYSNFGNTGGGILQVSGCTFHNNMFGAWLQHFQNYDASNNPTRDLSSFTNCTFKNDNVNPSFFGGGSMIRLHEVEGVRVSGCNLSDTRFNTFRGIWLENAGVDVNYNCMGIDIYGNCFSLGSSSVFSNLSYAIYGGGTYNAHKVRVQNTSISNCTYGAYLFGYTNPDFLRNSITINTGFSLAGISLEGCTGYRVEENTINGASPASNSGSFGITINNSGGNYNEIYRNNISNVNYAQEANGTNRSTTVFSNGLTYLCNSMTNSIDNAYDIFVSTTTNGTVNAMQGFPTTLAAASNTFSSFNPIYTDHNFRNGSAGVYYCYPHPPHLLFQLKA